jgi:hypothetical protein
VFGIFAQVAAHGVFESDRSPPDTLTIRADNLHDMPTTIEVCVGKVLPLFDVNALIKGIEWACEKECHIISLSLGMKQPSRDLEEAIKRASDQGVLIIAAGSNGGIRRYNNIAYPAAYSNVICVGSHSCSRHASSFSSEGKELEFLAPGENIFSLEAGGTGYVAVSGTSMATPAAAAVVAQILEYHKTRMYAYKNDETSGKTQFVDDFEERHTPNRLLLWYDELGFDYTVFERMLSEREIRLILRHMCSNRANFTSNAGHGCLDPPEFLLNDADSDSIYFIISRE